MTDIEKIKEDLKKMLKPSRYKHSIEVSKKALELGKIYNIDLNKCYTAAILHDCAKGNEIYYKNIYNEDYKELIVKKDLKEFENPFLQHCILGYIVAKNKYKVSDKEILNAILFHTTGRINMTELEKIIYISDKVEDSRLYPEVEKIRKESFFNINNAIILSINNNIEYLIEKKQMISVKSIELRNSLLGGISE